jgi:hypothetical protein
VVGFGGCGRVVEVKFGADLVGVGVSKFIENGRRLLPSATGGVDIAGGVVGVAEVGERVGFPVAAELRST